jgi:hypothetical protein
VNRLPIYLAIAFAVLLSPFVDARSPRLRNDEDSYLLVGVAPNAAAAYSLRPLAPAYERTLPLLRVRRSSDNAERDVFFYELTNGVLINWTGAGNAFVVNWRDQSGNVQNATQAAQGNQPQIVSGGALMLDGGKPAMNFDGLNDSLSTTSYIVELSKNAASVFAVQSQTGASWLNSYILSEGDLVSPYSSNFIFGGFNGSVVWVNGTTFGSIAASRTLIGFDWDRSVFQAHLNGVNSGALGSAIVNNEVLGKTVIGSRADQVTTFISANIQELLSYKLNQSGNRTGIAGNINAAWGVY